MKNIIGKGDIASVLLKQDKFLFFASGVSNSQETDEKEYQREIDLLFDQDREAHIVYFGSLSIFYSDTRYTSHKKLMETLIKENFKHYTIVRIGNIVWGSNPNTIINSFKNQVKNGEELDIRDEYRYVVEKKEFLHWINLIPEWSVEMNIPGQFLTINEIVEKYV